MATLLLVIIYAAFISLGLPDALLGASWPVMQPDLGVPYSYAGFVQILLSGGTICSSVASGALLKRFGTGKLTAASVALTAIALVGFVLAPSFWWILAAAIPLGLGGGAVDAGLNAYVANHYESRHMSWLHCFWGVGALAGPLALSGFLHYGFTWRMGYGTIAALQVVLVFALISAIPLWEKVKVRNTALTGEEDEHPHLPVLTVLRLRGAKPALVVYFFYCGIESSMGLWGGSYLVQSRGLDPAAAAFWVSSFFASITAGRFVTGFLTYRLSNNAMTRGGALTVLAGVVLLLAPFPLPVALVGYVLVGLGCAPIYPCMLHESPARFGPKNAQAIMGFQMAVAYVGATVLPPLLGFLGGEKPAGLLPVFVLGYVGILLLAFEVARRASLR